MARVITGDESRIYHFDPATKQESMHWKSFTVSSKEESPSGEIDE